MKSLRDPRVILALIVLPALLLLSCGSETTTTIQKLDKPPMSLSSPAFAHGGMIPESYSGRVSPPLEWKNVPAGTKSFALFMHNPDVERWRYVHWVLLNIPADTRYLPEGAGRRALVPGESMPLGGYIGVSPPDERRFNRYVFTLYALDTTLAPDCTPVEIEQLEQLVAGHFLAKAELMGRYGRSGLAVPRLW
jgi:hypothetical protein